MEAGDEDVSDLNEEFTSQILSGVRFAPLVTNPALTTIIPSNKWSPSIQRGYPPEFKRASMQLLMCSNSQLVQPITLPSIDERMNVSALLPRTIWLEILSYTHRKCKPIRIHSFASLSLRPLTILLSFFFSGFQPEQSETEYLKYRLRQEKAKLIKAEKARKEAEARCLAAERERVRFDKSSCSSCSGNLVDPNTNRHFRQSSVFWQCAVIHGFPVVNKKVHTLNGMTLQKSFSICWT